METADTAGSALPRLITASQARRFSDRLPSPVWALQRRLYLVALALAVMGVATTSYANATMQLVVGLAQVVLFGSLGNRVHRWLLERRGWRVTAEEPAPGSGVT